MVNVNELMEILDVESFSSQVGLKTDIENDIPEMYFSKSITRKIFKRDGEYVLRVSNFARNSFRAFSKIEVPRFVLRYFLDKGTMFNLKLSKKRRNLLEIECYNVNLIDIFFTQTDGFKRHNIKLNNDFFVSVWSNLTENEIKKRLK